MKLFNSFSNDKNPAKLTERIPSPLLHCRRPHLKIFYRIPARVNRRPRSVPFNHVDPICIAVYANLFLYPFKPRLRYRIACFYVRAAYALIEAQKYIVIYDIFLLRKHRDDYKKSNSLVIKKSN